MQYLVHTGFITVHLYCWSYQVWTGLALWNVETKVEKLKCRYINRGKFIDADDVMNQFLFYQSCPFKNIQRCIWWKKRTFYVFLQVAESGQVNIYTTFQRWDCSGPGQSSGVLWRKHISRNSWNLWKIC